MGLASDEGGLTMRRAPQLLLAVGIVSLGCSDTIAPSPATYVGTYPLRSVNNHVLPARVAASAEGCTESFQVGSLVLAARVFSIAFMSASACLGGIGFTGVFTSTGGSVAAAGTALALVAIDPTSPSSATMTAEVTVSGSDAILTLPSGALRLAGPTTFVFGPRQTVGAP